MQKEIHDQYGGEHSSDYWGNTQKTPEDTDHNKKEEYGTENTSFDHLLNIPTFRNIVSIEFFYFFTLYCFEVGHISISWASTSESLSEWMINEAMVSDKHPFRMSLG